MENTLTPSAENTAPDFGKFLRVEQFQDVKNQFILYFENGTIFQSYDSIIMGCITGDQKVYLGEDWKYSKTTSKYRNKFSSYTAKEIEEKLEDGTAEIVW